MPSPQPDEKQYDFIHRCMGDPEANKTFPEQEQRVAFCYSQWRDRFKKKASKFIIRTNGQHEEAK
jgi:hypothetical protein